MAAGLKVWDETGNLVVDLTTRLSRIVGVIEVEANTSGSVTVDATLGTPWAIPWPSSLGTKVLGAQPKIGISVSNGIGTISWQPSSPTPSINRGASLMYGVY